MSKICFYLFFAFLPFQIDALLVSSDVFYSGFFNPYLSHFLYLSDIFLMVGLLFFGIENVVKGRKIKFKEQSWIFWFLFGMVLMVGFSAVFASNPLNSLFYFLRFLELFVVYWIIANKFVKVRTLLYVFVGVMSAMALAGIFQYIMQESLGLRFFGEPLISSEELGVAKVTIFDTNILRAYGFFPHPNLFAAYLVFSIFFLIQFLREKVKLWRKFVLSFLLLITIFALIITFSRSAILGLGLGLIFYFAAAKMKFSWKWVLGILGGFCVLSGIIFVSGLYEILWDRFVNGDVSSLFERSLYLDISNKMLLNNPLGVGAGNFTDVMQSYTSAKLLPWLFQPVHNIFLLFANEVGVQGFVIFVGLLTALFIFILRSIKKQPLAPMVGSLLIFILVVGCFDHYLISLFQGQCLLFLFFGLTENLKAI